MNRIFMEYHSIYQCSTDVVANNSPLLPSRWIELLRRLELP